MNIVKVIVTMIALASAGVALGQTQGANFCRDKANEATRENEILVEEVASFIKKCVDDLGGVLDTPTRNGFGVGQQRSFFTQLPTGEQGQENVQENVIVAAPAPVIVYGDSAEYYRYQYPYNSYGFGFPFGIFPGHASYANQNQSNVHVVNPSCFDQGGDWERNMACVKLRNRQNLIGGGIAAAAIIAVQRHNR